MKDLNLRDVMVVCITNVCSKFGNGARRRVTLRWCTYDKKYNNIPPMDFESYDGLELIHPIPLICFRKRVKKK